MSGPITLAVEGTTDAAVARRLLDEAGLQVGPEYVKNGSAALDESLGGFNKAARFSRWLVLRDLDRDASCAPELCRRLLPAPSAFMRLHIPVHAVEAWLLADAEAMSRCLSIAQARVPRYPEALLFPKRELVELARRSRKRSVCDALVPAPGTTARVGPGYAAFLIDFAMRRWRPAIAAKRSRSLARLRDFLRTLA